jgi:putative spermidine/putrescine transport system substrate-binding protein
LQAQAQAGQVGIDLMMVNSRVYQAMVAQKLTTPLDMNKVPAAKELDQNLAFPSAFGSPPGAVRSTFALDILAYNRDVLAKKGLNPPTSWQDLVDPKYASCAVLINPVSQINYIPLLNHSLGADYSDISASLNRMKPLKKQYVAIVNSTPAALEVLQQGKACIAPNSMARTIEQMAAGAPLGYAVPQDGTSFIEGVLVIPRNAPHPVAANIALNALLSKAGMQEIRDRSFWSVSNVQVAKSDKKFISEVPLAKDFNSLGTTELPPSAFSGFEGWSAKWNSVFAG